MNATLGPFFADSNAKHDHTATVCVLSEYDVVDDYSSPLGGTGLMSSLAIGERVACMAR